MEYNNNKWLTTKMVMVAQCFQRKNRRLLFKIGIYARNSCGFRVSIMEWHQQEVCTPNVKYNNNP